jgi:hypothetical protein
MRMKLLIACVIAVASFGVARQAEASSCSDQFSTDILLCSGMRTSCLNDPGYSFWTGTCNLQYGGCILAAELLFGACAVPILAG